MPPRSPETLAQTNGEASPMKPSAIRSLLLLLPALCLLAGCRTVSEEQLEWTANVSEMARVSTPGGRPSDMTEEEVLRRLGQPDIRVSMKDLGERAQRRPEVERLLLDLSIRLMNKADYQSIGSTAWWQKEPYSKSTLLAYDEGLRFKHLALENSTTGPMAVGMGFLVAQGEVIAAGNLQNFGGDHGSGWRAALNPEDFVQPAAPQP